MTFYKVLHSAGLPQLTASALFTCLKKVSLLPDPSQNQVT